MGQFWSGYLKIFWTLVIRSFQSQFATRARGSVTLDYINSNRFLKQITILLNTKGGAKNLFILNVLFT